MPSLQAWLMTGLRAVGDPASIRMASGFLATIASSELIWAGTLLAALVIVSLTLPVNGASWAATVASFSIRIRQSLPRKLLDKYIVYGADAASCTRTDAGFGAATAGYVLAAKIAPVARVSAPTRHACLIIRSSFISLSIYGFYYYYRVEPSSVVASAGPVVGGGYRLR